jgi:arylsulfatase
VFEYSGEIAGLPPSDAPSVLNRSFTITAEIEVPQGGAEGMLATLGGRFGGYGLYLLKGVPVFTYNLVDLERFRWAGKDALAAGKHTVTFDFTYAGPGPGKGGNGSLLVDGTSVDSHDVAHTIPFIMSIDETFDVGVDTRTSVDDKDYQVPFAFTGKLNKLTIKIGTDQLADADRKALEEKVAQAKN